MPNNLRKRTFQNRLPADFIPRTLKRLLPLDNLSSLNHFQLVQLAAQAKKLKHLIRSDPSRFFQPNAGGQRNFLTFRDHDLTKRVLLFLAGNKTGKTTGGAMMMGERLLGKALWNRSQRENVSYPTPAVGIVFTEDFEGHRDTILPTILSWWPKDSIRRIAYTSQNCPSELILNNDSILKFKTYAQGADTAEGKDWDAIWFDEPPPHSIYTAAFRGTVATDGFMYVTATLLKEAWLFDEQEQDYAVFFAADIHDNEWLGDDARNAFLSSLSDEERDVRETGKPISLTGVIYKYFKDDYPYVIPPFQLNERWPYFIGVDPHERRPVHVLFCTISPEEELIVFDYLLPRGDTQQIIEQIRTREQHLGLAPIRLCIMDPNRGAARQINNVSWEDVFSEAGYQVVLGQDDVNIGHAEMYRWLRIQEKTHRPRLMFTMNCRNKYGPIWQMQRYAWDDWVGNSRRERDVKEKPKNFNKDFPDILRYIVMENMTFSQLRDGPKIIKTVNDIQGYGTRRPSIRASLPGYFH